MTDEQRRATIKLLGGVAGLAGASDADAAATPALRTPPVNAATGVRASVMTRVIDTHHHMVPAFYVDAVGRDAIAATTPTRHAPEWTPEADLAMLDRNGIDKALLSASPGLFNMTGQAAIAMCRRLNEYGAELVARHPSRYGHFAILPLPDVDASLNELAYALDTLQAQGVILFSNYAGRYLGDVRFEPVHRELQRRKAVAFVHPTIVPYTVTDLPASILEFPFDTTRAIATLIYNGITLRYPDIRFIFSHGGGAAPYLAGRLDGPTRLIPALGELLPNGVMPEMRKLYFDTALTTSPAALRALLTITDASHLLFGSDFPFAPEAVTALSLQGVRANLSAAELDNVLSKSATDLLPSLAT